MDNNGQMHIDYLIGIAIFLVSIIFVFSYTAGLFTPFQSNSDEVTLIADRVSTNIIEQNMSAGKAGATTLLNGTRVNDLFNYTDSNYQNTLVWLGMDGTYLKYDLNITYEDTAGTVIRSAGETLPVNGNIGQTIRVVLIRDEKTGNTSQAIIAVRVW
ncbi:DUF7287 family protein [Methanolobus halotolerans]|uniref:Uncharacterized protein n=1 Tax=Methanolobus halotolerans TaxID=2052935 RepID=A0A4E0QQA0_9EURY|nr:hypothetical protein [Methanolobus halotolerans]TGC07301.1 hypothetical protein CUN85_11650 [Methanolobus halotolerans]